MQTCGPNLKLKMLKANVKGPAITYIDLTSKLCSYFSISDKHNTKDQLIQVAVGLTTGTESILEASQFLTPPTLSDWALSIGADLNRMEKRNHVSTTNNCSGQHVVRV